MVELVVYLLSGFLISFMVCGEDRCIKSWCNGKHWGAYFHVRGMQWRIKIVDQNYKYPKPNSHLGTVYAPDKSCKIILKTASRATPGHICNWEGDPMKQEREMYLFAESDNSMHCSYVVSMSEDEELITFHSEPIADNEVALKTCHGTYLYATENGSFTQMKSSNYLPHNQEFIFTVEQYKIRDQPEEFAYRFKSCHGTDLNDGLGLESSSYCVEGMDGSMGVKRDTGIDGFTVYVMEYTGVEIEVQSPVSPPVPPQTVGQTIIDNDDNDENAASPIYEDIEKDEQLEGVANHTNMVNESDVGIWLKSLGDVYYDDYYRLFVDNGYDEIKIVETMTDDELQQIGVNKMGHRRKLIMEIAKLSNNE